MLLALKEHLQITDNVINNLVISVLFQKVCKSTPSSVGEFSL